jgi:hypothetical protein
MTRLLATTAVLMSLSGAVYAQSASTAPTTDGDAVTTENAGSGAMTTDSANTDTMSTDSATDTSPMGEPMELAGAVATPTDFMASNLIGMRIYNVEADYDTMTPIADGAETEWDDIGEINDIVLTADGEVSAVILGVGGFLGIGERDVAVNMGALTVVNEEGDTGDRFLVVKTSKEQLEQLAEFERGDI